MLTDAPEVSIKGVGKEDPYFLPDTPYKISSRVDAVPTPHTQAWLWQPCQVLPQCTKVNGRWQNLTIREAVKFQTSGHLRYVAENSEGIGTDEVQIKVAGSVYLDNSWKMVGILTDVI